MMNRNVLGTVCVRLVGERWSRGRRAGHGAGEGNASVSACTYRTPPPLKLNKLFVLAEG